MKKGVLLLLAMLLVGTANAQSRTEAVLRKVQAERDKVASATSLCTSAAPCSLFVGITPTGSPSNPSGVGVGPAIEVGLRFYSDSAGTLTGIKFYKPSKDTATTHTVNLWSATGTKIAFAATTSETASGWQTATFVSPVALAARTEYVASYGSKTGTFSFTWKSFLSAVNVVPLHAVADTTATPNGVSIYSVGSFPPNHFNSTNYFVDVLFVKQTVTVTATLDNGQTKIVTTNPALAGLSKCGTLVCTTSMTGGGTSTVVLMITIAPSVAPVTITTTTLPAGMVGVAYSDQLAATGGIAPYVWSITEGQLPAGLTLSGSGLIAGTPTMASIASFTVMVQDAVGKTAKKSFGKQGAKKP